MNRGKESEDWSGGFFSEWVKEEIGRRGSIESQGRIWAQKKAEAMKSGADRPVIIVRITPEYEKVRKLISSRITLGGRGDATDIPYDEEGNMWITTWPDVPTEDDPKSRRRHIVNPKEYAYQILNPLEIRTRDVESLPLGRKVIELRFSKLKTIEKGIRLPGHVIEKAMDTEVSQARVIVKATNSLATEFLMGGITKSKLEILARKMGDYLEETGVFRPRLEDKINMIDMLLKASKPDSLGRVNPLVSRIRARSAFLSASKRMIVQGFVVAKFEKIRGILVYERETTRWVLENALDQLKIYVLGINAMKKPGQEDTVTQRHGLFATLNTVSEELLTTVRVRPYLAPSREAASNLVHSADMVLVGQYRDARNEVISSIAILREVLDNYADIETADKKA